MKSKVIENREDLLEISKRKLKLLESLIDHIEHIESNPVFVEEVDEAFNDLHAAESSFLDELSKTVQCPGCGFECDQIYSYCMACGTKLSENPDSTYA